MSSSTAMLYVVAVVELDGRAELVAVGASAPELAGGRSDEEPAVRQRCREDGLLGPLSADRLAGGDVEEDTLLFPAARHGHRDPAPVGRGHDP